MHWENLGVMGPYLPVLALFLLAPFAIWLWSKMAQRRAAAEQQAAVERYWALEMAHRAKMRALSWIWSFRTRKLAFQPMASDAEIAGQLAHDYGSGDMTDHSFDTRLARAKFRAWHRGTREADYTIGGFFDRYHTSWGEDDLAWFEGLLEEEDSDILGWAMTTHAAPEKYQGALMSALQKLDYVAI